MKRLLILAALGLFLAAHGVVGFMSIYPQPNSQFNQILLVARDGKL
jgi:hypothetical protein